MDLMQIRGFHIILDESRMPDVLEDGKFPKWNNTIGAFEYTCIKGSEYETFVDDVSLTDNVLNVHRNDDVEWFIDLTTLDPNLELPGDKKILFDENDTIGGRDNFTYDYTTHQVILTDVDGIYGMVTGKDSAPVNILQYLGDHNLYLNYGTTKTSVFASMTDNIALGRHALAEMTEGSNNIAIGAYAGSDAYRQSSDNVYIGAYAGRLNTNDNRLYIHNADFTSLQESKDGSLLYGEFDNGLLYINNRLNVREEVHIGTFDVANTPLGGMVQFIDAGGGLVKPQYYDETQWVDFANGIDSYLTGITNDGEEWTFTVDGQPDIVVTIPDTYLTVAGDIYNVQLNNGAGDLAASSNLSFNTVNNVLTLDGALYMPAVTVADYPVNNGNILYDGVHFYGYTDGEYVQLDNEDTASGGKYSIGESVGSGVEVYAGLDSKRKVLQFYDLVGGAGITINDADEFGNIYVELDFDVDAVNLGIVGQEILATTTKTDTSAIINARRLHSSDGSVTITNVGDYLDFSATGAGGGEVNDGENVGAGEGRVYDEVTGKNGLLIPFRTIKEGNNTTVVTDTVNKIITVDVPTIVTDAANIAGGDANWYKDYTDVDGKRTLNFRPIEGVDDVTVTLNGDVVEIGFDSAIKIPSIEGVILPVSTDADTTLTWHLIYDEDTRNSSPTTEDIMQIKLGSNLTYNSTTNTLDAIGGAAGGYITQIANASITRNGDGTVDRTSSNRNVVYTEGGSSYTWVGGTTNGLGWLAFEDDYPVASDTQQGIVQIDITGPLSITDGVLAFEGSFAPADPDTSIQFNNGGVFGGSAGMLYDSVNDRIMLSAQTAANAGIDFDGTSIYGEDTGVSGDHLYIKADGTTDSLQMLVSKLSIGWEDKLTDSFITVRDPNLQAKANTLVISDWDGNNTIVVANDSSIYLPQLVLNDTDFVVGFDSDTKKLYYTSASNVAGIVTVNTGDESGLDVDGTNASSASSIYLNQNDYKLVENVLDVDDWIGFWDTSAGVQSRTKIGDIISALELQTDLSVEGDGSLTTPIVLVNDEDAPGIRKFYGTDATGDKGWQDALAIVTINADADSGMMVDGGSTSTDGEFNIDQNDNKLIEDTIALGDYIGFWDIDDVDDTYKQNKTTLEDLIPVINPAITIDPSQVSQTVDSVNHGFLYNWLVVDESQSHNITSDDSWIVPGWRQWWYDMYDYLTGGNLKEEGFISWNSPNTGADNLYGFGAKASGVRSYSDGTYDGILTSTSYWCTQANTDTAYYAGLRYDSAALFTYHGSVSYIIPKNSGISVRLTKEAPGIDDGETTTYIGNDGKIYNAIVINERYWTTTNLAETKYRDGSWIDGYNNGVYTEIADSTWANLSTGALCAYEDDLNNVLTTTVYQGTKAITDSESGLMVDDGDSSTNLEKSFDQNDNKLLAGDIAVDDPIGFWDADEAKEKKTTLGNMASIISLEITIDPSQVSQSVDSSKYGFLYNWYAVADGRELTSSDDWTTPNWTIVAELWAYTQTFGYVYPIQALCKDFYWNDTGGAGTAGDLRGDNDNALGLSLIAHGARSGSGSSGLGEYSWFWTTDDYGGSGARGYGTEYDSTLFEAKIITETSAYAVRLVKDATGLIDGTTTTYTGNDGKAYIAIVINELYWTIGNLAETQYRDGSWIAGYDAGVYTLISDATWGDLSTGALCAYDDDLNNVLTTTIYQGTKAASSVTGDGINGTEIQLVNDEDAPAIDSYYGTDGAGNKGYQPLPTVAVDSKDSVTGDGQVGTELALVNDVDAPGAKYYYGTDASGNKAWIPFCETVSSCIDDNPEIVVPPVDPTTGNVNIAISRTGCDDAFGITADQFVDTIINLTNIRIDSVPANGRLIYNGSTVIATDVLNVIIGTFEYTLEYEADVDTGSAYNDTFTFSTLYSSNTSYSAAAATVNVSVDACISDPLCYGYLYNWYAVDDSRNITSDSEWSVSSAADWDNLAQYISDTYGPYTTGGTGFPSYWTGVGDHLKSNILWDGTNDLGFNAVPNGVRYANGTFALILTAGYYHISDDLGTITASRYIEDNGYLYWRLNTNYVNASAIRLTKDATGLADGETTTYTGNDGKTYNAIVINELYWTTSNLEETRYRGTAPGSNDGDLIIHEGVDEGIMSNAEWAAATYGAWCLYNDNLNYSCNYVVPENETRCYGYLYNKVAIFNYDLTTSSTLITSSDDWRIPTNVEATALSSHVGGLAGKLREVGLIYWDTSNSTVDNATKLSLVGSGSYVTLLNGSYDNLKVSCSISLYATSATIGRMQISSSSENIDISTTTSNTYQSIRLVKTTVDPDLTMTTYIGNDGRIYDAVAINGLYWLTSNLEETRLRDSEVIPHIRDVNTGTVSNLIGLTYWNGDTAFTCNGGALETDEYNLAASYENGDFDISLQATNSFGVSMNPTGTRAYVLDSSTNFIYQYDLSTAFDISTAVYNSISLDIGYAHDGLRFKPDGSILYISYAPTEVVRAYNLSTPWDINGGVEDYVLTIRVEGMSDWGGMDFSPDGTKMYSYGHFPDMFYQWELATAWDVRTYSFVNKIYIDPTVGAGGCMQISPNGEYLYCQSGVGALTIARFSLSTAWDITTMTFDHALLSTINGGGTHFIINFDDRVILVLDRIYSTLHSQDY